MPLATQRRPLTTLLSDVIHSSKNESRQPLLAATFIGLLSASGQVFAEDTQNNSEPAATLDPMTVQFRGEQVDSPKYSRSLLETPRIINILSADLLEEQNVTSLRDAFRNVTGISLQAGEGNPPAGDQLKIRGFNARDDINVNGVRDMGNYFRDPFYLDQLEVIKGPNSAFSGRGSSGGTINFVTKKPFQEDFNRLELSAGTDDLRRATIDVNKTIDDNSAFRINLLSHASDFPGRDVAEEERQGFYGAYTWGFQEDTLVTVDFLHTRQDNLPDAGLPFDRGTRLNEGAGTGKIPSGLDYDNFYGHTDDYQDVDVNQFGVAIEHSFNDRVALRNQLRYSAVDLDSIVSSPRIITTNGSLENAQARGDLKPRDQEDRALFNQTDLLVSFDTGSFSHDLVAGVEFGYTDAENQRRPDVNGPATDLYDPQRRTRPAAPYDGTSHRFETQEAAVYLLDTIALSEQWDLHGGVRYDRVKAEASEKGKPDNIKLERTDNEWSGNLGLVFKPNNWTSYYASVGTAYQISGNYDRNQVQLAGGEDDFNDPNGRTRVADPTTFNIEPEETVAYELGAKWDVLDNLMLNAAIFRTDKTNARTPSVDGTTEVLNGEQRVDGFELIAAGNISPRWNLYGSYTYMTSELRKSNIPFEEGQRLGGTPRHSLSLFSTYDITPKFSLGGGMLFVSDQDSNVQSEPTPRRIKVSIPSYTVFDAYAKYQLTSDVQLRLNALNIFDKEYIAQMAEGGAQGIPGAGRQIIGTIRYDF
ncbi:MAG: TonB-dependent siderophore receptor [Methylophaga sp.]